jgi:hypothetical protein
MLDLLPDLSGQPAWVVIVVVALFVAGTVGVKWVGRNVRAGIGDEDAEADRPGGPPLDHAHPALSASDAHTTLAITKALDLLANEAVESQGARAEVERLRAELIACSAERDRVARNLAKAQADLEQCNRECRKLAMRALERRGDSGE